MAYKKKQKEEADIVEPIIESTKPVEPIRSRYMITNKISGNINNRKIEAKRGDIILLNEREYSTFKDFALLIGE